VLCTLSCVAEVPLRSYQALAITSFMPMVQLHSCQVLTTLSCMLNYMYVPLRSYQDSLLLPIGQGTSQLIPSAHYSFFHAQDISTSCYFLLNAGVTLPSYQAFLHAQDTPPLMPSAHYSFLSAKGNSAHVTALTVSFYMVRVPLSSQEVLSLLRPLLPNV
jgi:hypothetical protein